MLRRCSVGAGGLQLVDRRSARPWKFVMDDGSVAADASYTGAGFTINTETNARPSRATF